MQNCGHFVFDTSILSLYMAFIHLLKTYCTYSWPFHTCAQSFFLTCFLSLYMPFIHVYVLKIRPTAHSHDLVTLMHSCISFFSLLSFHCTWQSYMYLRPTAHTPSLTWSCRTYTQSFFFLTRILSLYMAFIYSLLSYDLVTLKHSVFPCLRKVVWIRDFICLNLICISHFKTSTSKRTFIQSLYLSVHITSLHTLPLLILLNSSSGYHAYFSRRKQILFHSLNLFSLSMNLLVATGESTKQLTTTTASTCKFRNILTINNNTLLLIVEKHAHYEGICPATFLN